MYHYHLYFSGVFSDNILNLISHRNLQIQRSDLQDRWPVDWRGLWSYLYLCQPDTRHVWVYRQVSSFVYLMWNMNIFNLQLFIYIITFTFVYRFSHHFYGHTAQNAYQNNKSAISSSQPPQPNRKSRSRERPFQKSSNTSSSTNNGGAVNSR